MYNPDYDYNANPRYKVVYLVSNNISGLYTATDLTFAQWASVMNVEYTSMIDFGGDDDGMMAQIPQLARDYDGLIFDANGTMYDRVNEIMKDYPGTAWMSFMGPPRDYSLPGLPLMHPYVGFEQIDVGRFFAEYMYNKAKVTWPDVPISEFGFMTVDYSGIPALNDRAIGFREVLGKLDPDAVNNRYWEPDTAINFFDADTSQQVVSAVLSMHPEITHWIIFGEVDDMAQGAAAALDLAGLSDTSWATAFGGSGLQVQWDAGITSAWKSAQFLPQSIFTEPVFGALYAFMNGDATPENLWPEWVNKNEDTAYGVYPTRLLPWYEILQENYKHLLEWSDVYANSNIYPYPSDWEGKPITRDDFSAKVPIPAYFN
jgi:hypothetical protein